MPVGNEALFKVRVLQLLVHLLAEVGLGVVVRVGVFEEDAELAIEAALDRFAIFNERVGLCGKFEALGVTEDMLLETLNRRDPCRFSDKSCYFVNVGLNCGQDLNA